MWTLATSVNQDEFSAERHAMIQVPLSAVRAHPFVVEDAVVVAIGPSGLLLRALLRKNIYKEAGKQNVERVQRTIIFDDVAKDVESLRAAVSREIDAVQQVINC